jgi:uncharacterized membrane protein YuzA (DUF378 family)
MCLATAAGQHPAAAESFGVCSLHANARRTTMATTSDPRPHTNYTPARPHRYKLLDYVALALLIVGGLNWGLIGIFTFDLVAAVFGPMTLLSRLVYVLVGFAAVYGIGLLWRTRSD